jgi:hypothetical protein
MEHSPAAVATPRSRKIVVRYIRGMYVLDGGPRAGQLVDDLPAGYALDGSSRRSFTPLLIGDIPAALAVWNAADEAPPAVHLRRVE